MQIQNELIRKTFQLFKQYGLLNTRICIVEGIVLLSPWLLRTCKRLIELKSCKMLRQMDWSHLPFLSSLLPQSEKYLFLSSLAN